MTLVEFLQYLVTPVGLGLAARTVMYLIQKAKPEVADDLAFALSVLVAAVAGLIGFFAIPFAEKLPPEVGTVVWPVLTWAWNYVWFRFGPKADGDDE
jgi:hypothetical protein